MNLRDLPLGSLIVRDGLARPDDVRTALIEAQETDRRLGEVMLERGWIRERDLARLLAEQEKLEFVDLAKIDLVDEAVDCIPEQVARRHRAVGYAFAGKVVLVAVADPTDDAGLDAVRDSAGRRVRFRVALASEIDSALAEARDVAVTDRDLGVEPLAREDGEDPAALDDDVGELVAAGHGQPSGEIGHSPTIYG